jgi:hypothetical protein
MIDGLRDSRWLSRAQIDDADWNARVAAFCGGSAGYMHTAYLDAVAPAWGALLFADGGLFPIWPRGWGPLRQCRQPWFVQHLAVLPPSECPISSGQNRPSARELAERLTHARLAVLKGASLLEFQVDEPPPLADQVPAGWQAIGRTTYRLPIDSADSQATRAGYSGHHRRLIRPIDGLHYGKTNNPDPFLRLFVAQVAGKAGLTAEQIRSLGRLLKSLLGNQHAVLWTLMREQELLCGCVLLRSGDRLVYQLAGSSGASMQMGGMHRLVDHILHRPEYRGLTLDFEGSDLTGLQRFYSGFGARPHTYTRWLLDKRHPILKRVQRI